MSDLFRHEAVRHATRRLSGEAALASSVASRLISVTLVTILLLAAASASMVAFARKETIAGWVAPVGGI
ncbi:hypothetical protein [Brevundimonas sp. 2YAF1]|uniref:hypothetical protein n=1 Tax=Brevundimonas sp. 2YAF1 TaxID=3233024 RepID=UPI003F92B596